MPAFRNAKKPNLKFAVNNEFNRFRENSSWKGMAIGVDFGR